MPYVMPNLDCSRDRQSLIYVGMSVCHCVGERGGGGGDLIYSGDI